MCPGLGPYCADLAQPLTMAGEELDELDQPDDLDHGLVFELWKIVTKGTKNTETFWDVERRK